MTISENPPVERLALSARQAAVALGFSYHTVMKLVQEGFIPSFKVGTRTTVSVDVLREVVRKWSEQGATLPVYDNRGSATADSSRPAVAAREQVGLTP